MPATEWPDPTAAIAPPEYAQAAREGAEQALTAFADDARRILVRAQDEARQEDDNHVGTEHLVLALFALPECVGARALAAAGISRPLFAEQRHHEEGPSPAGEIPRTPRANRIIVLAHTIARARDAARVTSGHLLLGVVAESEEWEASGRAGPHHLRGAAMAIGKTLADVRVAAEKLLVADASEPSD